MSSSLDVDAILFDLDGTLIDSAPDLAGAANDMRVARGLEAHELNHYRAMVGSGARGMLSRAFEIDPEADSFIAMRDEFLSRYELRMTRDTRVFSDVLPLLHGLDAGGQLWGIVTNKAERFAMPLVDALPPLATRAVLICGDTTPHAKPHPEPLLEAARRLGLPPARCLYVGDDHRDVLAGKAAGMATAAAAWGYLGAGEPVDAWGADIVLTLPDDLLKLLAMT
jgi:N-acetyl-D-muramate 6-phosphate phosphatase